LDERKATNMSKVAIVTDSTVCLPPHLVQRYGIEIVPMEVIHEGKVYRDGVDISPSEFYKLLAKANKLPTTSAPSSGTYFEVLKKVSSKAKDILVITLSAKFSHAFNSAKAAAEMGKDQLQNTVIEVLDCGTAAGAQGLIVLEAARAAAIDRNLSGVLESARDLMSKVHLIAFIDTLQYLAKGGRVPQVAAWASALLKIKPLFELLPLSGGAIPLGKVRTRGRAIERLVKLLRERTDRKPMHGIVLHTNALAEAENLEKRIASEFNCDEIYVRDFSPVMGVHIGPGLLGIAFYFDEPILK
jgi:DegV family protein with EDD domain